MPPRKPASEWTCDELRAFVERHQAAVTRKHTRRKEKLESRPDELYEFRQNRKLKEAARMQDPAYAAAKAERHRRWRAAHPNYNPPSRQLRKRSKRTASEFPSSRQIREGSKQTPGEIPSDTPYHTVHELEYAANLPAETIYDLARSRRIQTVNFGQTVLIPDHEYKRLLAEGIDPKE